MMMYKVGLPEAPLEGRTGYIIKGLAAWPLDVS